SYLAKQGVATLSADDLAHDCIRKGKPAYRAILKQFGREVLDAKKNIDRRCLGNMVFADPKQRRRLERIVHPCVAKGIRKFIRSHRGIVALDIPLLFEAHYESWVDRIVVVYSTRSQQIRRLIKRNGLTRSEALQRIQAQMPLAGKCRKADIVL